MKKERDIINIDPKIKYLPSEPCSCEICVNYCKRPGWWTLEEAKAAIRHGLAKRMMLEVSPELDFAVLSPAFKGNESNFAYQIFAQNGCTFLNNGLCELFDTGLEPLECRYCHHSRKGLGKKCHTEIGMQWNSQEGKRLIVKWGNLTGFWRKQGFLMFEK